MRVFLTGGSGFVGQHLIHHLREQGHTVLALARSPRSAQIVTQAGAQPVPGDLGELIGDGDPPARWLPHLSDVDAVVHAAALMEFWGRDSLFKRANYEPSLGIASGSRRRRCHQVRASQRCECVQRQPARPPPSSTSEPPTVVRTSPTAV